jgi:hypothetical protein
MQLVCVAEVNSEHEIKLDDHIKNRLHPGEKVKLRIELIDQNNEKKRLKAIERLRTIGMSSKLGLYDNIIRREDGHRDIIPGL